MKKIKENITKKGILLMIVSVVAFGGDSNLKYYEYADKLNKSGKDHIIQHSDFYTKGFLEDMNLKRGKQVYTMACENCHGVNGDKSLIKNLKNYDEEELFAIVQNYMYTIDNNQNIDSTTSLKQILLTGYSSVDIKNMIAYINLKDDIDMTAIDQRQ